MPVILLIDNGSVRAEATRQLRKLAEKLSAKTGYLIHPVSLKHADRIAIENLDGKPAQVFREFMHQQLSEGVSEFLLLPLFFGESKALTSYLADETDRLKQQFGHFIMDIAQLIYPLPEGEELLTQIIFDHIQFTKEQSALPIANPIDNIVLVDHGSPNPRVTEVRQHLANSVQKMLPKNCLLEQAVMERREGQQYNFNGVLLRDCLLQKADDGETNVMVILLFFLPGRHAGKGGDIFEICQSVMHEFPGFNVSLSPLITEHPLFISILQNRLNDLIEHPSH